MFAGFDRRAKPWRSIGPTQRRFSKTDRSRHSGCGGGHGHQSLPLLDVYRRRGWERQRNQQAGKTKVTRSSVAEAPARWFFCWRFACGCAPAFGRMELIYFRTYPGFRSLRSLHPGLRLCRSAGWILEAQVIAQKRGANPSTGSGQALGHRAIRAFGKSPTIAKFRQLKATG